MTFVLPAYLLSFPRRQEEDAVCVELQHDHLRLDFLYGFLHQLLDGGKDNACV